MASDQSIAIEQGETPVVYRDCPGCPGYRVGSDGTVWMRSRQPGGGWRLKATRTKAFGHLSVSLTVGGVERKVHVHRLVLEAFIGPRPEGMECRHLDGNPANNSLSNLRWGTHRENEADKVRHGTHLHGERNHSAKLSVTDVLQIRQRYDAAKGRRRRAPNGTATALAREYGVHVETVKQIARRVGWRYDANPSPHSSAGLFDATPDTVD